MPIDSSPSLDTGPVLSPKEQVLAAERAFMKAQSKFVNQFDPSTEDSDALTAAANRVNELYAKYPEHMPVQKAESTIDVTSTSG